MQEGFPAKKKITNRGMTFGTPNGGRYFYVLAFTNSPRAVLCIDSTLLTAANYAGAGVWTVSPIVADITISDNPTTLVYRADLQQVWVVGHNATFRPFITRIDANPNSGTFNTILTTETSTTASAVGASSVFDYVNNTLFIGDSSNGLNLWRFNPDGSTKIVERGSILPNPVFSVFDLGSSQVFTSDISQGVFFFDVSKSLTDVLMCRKGVINNAVGGIYVDSQYVYVSFYTAGQMRVFDKSTLNLTTSISLSNIRNCKFDTNHNYNRIITGSYFSNSISFLEVNTLISGGNLAKGATINSESGTISISNIGDVAVAVPVGGTCQHVHVFNTAAKSWIGYLPLGKTIGVSLATGSGGYGAYVGGHVLCKNSI
jgi:hypothetical protein